MVDIAAAAGRRRTAAFRRRAAVALFSLAVAAVALHAPIEWPPLGLVVLGGFAAKSAASLRLRRYTRDRWLRILATALAAVLANVLLGSVVLAAVGVCLVAVLATRPIRRSERNARGYWIRVDGDEHPLDPRTWER